MAVDVDVTRQHRKPSDLLSLVGAVRDALPADESDWIEWKSTLDLTSKAAHFHLAKQIIGMANRPVDRATRSCGGLGYVLIGVEPGRLDGVEQVDPARLGDWLTPYLGADGPEYSTVYLRAGDHEVLVLTVEPPRPGDPIHTLRKTFQNDKVGGADDGTVFVRTPGQSKPATSEQLRALTDRLTDGKQEQHLDLDVSVATAPTVRCADVGGDTDEWLAQHAARLLDPVDRPRKAASPIVAENLLALPSVAALQGIMRDRRSADGFREQVSAYLAKVRAVLPSAYVHRLAEDDRIILQFAVTNRTERNYTGVEIDVRLQDGTLPLLEADEPVWPVPPRDFGTPPPPGAHTGFSFESLSAVDRLTLPRIAMAGSAKIETRSDGEHVVFPLGQLRPRARLATDPVLLCVLGTGPVVAAWSATATNVDHLLSGETTIDIPEIAVTLGDALPPTTTYRK